MSPVRRPPLLVLLSPTTLLLLLLMLGTAPHTLATQLQGDIEADVRLMLDMVRRHMMTASTVLEDVKLLTMSVEQMAQRIDTLETTVTQRMDSLETTVARRMDTLEATVAAHIIDMTNQTEKISTEMAKVQDQIANQTKKIEDEIANERRKDHIANDVTRLFEPMVADLVAIREHLMSPRDCSDVATERNRGSGTYDIFPSGEAMHVYCDIEGSEGWTVLQRRVNGPQDFDKDWAEYKKGFGDLEGEHWVGNENMHILTSRREYTIQIVLEDCGQIGDVLVANYSRFSVGSEGSGYRLTVDGFSGNATDGMNGCESNRNHNGQKFTTKDRNNGQSSVNRAQKYPGAWWFPNVNYCTHLNRQGLSSGTVIWHYDSSIQCKKTKMRIKPLTS